jgi:hypothetical protein
LSTGGALSGEQWTVVVGATTAAFVFIGLMIFLCCCCLCKKKKDLEKKKNAKGAGYRFFSSEALNSFVNPTPKKQKCFFAMSQ